MRGALVQTVEFGVRQLRRVVSLSSMVILGATRKEELRQAIVRGWRRYGEDGADVPAVLAGWESDFYDAHLEPGSRIMLVGCGAGRDLIALIERGHRVDGLDIEKDALAVCRSELQKRGKSATLYEGSVEEARFDAAPYDAALFSWFAYGYTPGAAARIRTLARLREILRPRGRVLLTYQPRPATLSRVPSALARLSARVTGSDWTPEHGDFVELIGVGERALHFEHRFAAAELVDEAERAGLRVHWHEHAREGRLVLLRD